MVMIVPLVFATFTSLFKGLLFAAYLNLLRFISFGNWIQVFWRIIIFLIYALSLAITCIIIANSVKQFQTQDQCIFGGLLTIFSSLMLTFTNLSITRYVHSMIWRPKGSKISTNARFEYHRRSYYPCWFPVCFTNTIH